MNRQSGNAPLTIVAACAAASILAAVIVAFLLRAKSAPEGNEIPRDLEERLAALERKLDEADAAPRRTSPPVAAPGPASEVDELTAKDAAVVSTKARGALDRAVELDGEHWDARFTRAMMNTFAPDVMGLRASALKDFEILARQQESLPKTDSHATTWLFLGNLHAGEGRTDEARKAWRSGLDRFPDNERLRKRLASLDG